MSQRHTSPSPGLLASMRDDASPPLLPGQLRLIDCDWQCQGCSTVNHAESLESGDVISCSGCGVRLEFLQWLHPAGTNSSEAININIGPAKIPEGRA